jgi:hypothetical protein
MRGGVFEFAKVTLQSDFGNPYLDLAFTDEACFDRSFISKPLSPVFRTETQIGYLYLARFFLSRQ